MPALSKDEIDAMMKGEKKLSNLMKNKNLHFKLIYKSISAKATPFNMNW